MLAVRGTMLTLTLTRPPNPHPNPHPNPSQVRGTMRLHDVLTDLVCEHVALAGGAGGAGGAGEAHGGMLEAAQRLLEQQRPMLEVTLRLTLPLTPPLTLTRPDPDRVTFTVTLALALTRRRCAFTPATPSC